ncbi:MAG TPA: MtrB/PioB family outer membrane beta-barrel protein, partial [Geobacterales bacterium]|nr:MtrB/PioB family outer membrane beta-barrel protein [Geobacterales bacterium]
LGGGLSLYDNADTSFTFQNPWNAVDTATRPSNNLYSLAPSNKAESISVQGGVGLPFNSRYMGTFQYTNLQVDDANLPWTNNTAYGVTPAFLTPSRNASTTLSNNVLHTQITSDLKSTLKYRYYNYNTKDDSPVVVFGSVPLPWCGNPDSASSCNTTNEMRYPSNFTKQNADAQLDYRPWKWLNVGASYDWERWDRDFRNVATTTENGGKVFGDAKLGGFSMLRASLLYAQRRYDNYVNFDGTNIDQYRMNDLANRDRTKGMVSWAVDVTHEITITPNGGFTYDDYKTDIEFFTPGEIGLKKTKSWNAGIDGTFNVAPGVALFASYNFEDGYRQVYENAAIPKANVETTDLNHTIILGGKFTLIPAKLFLDANYTYTRSTSEWDLGCTPAGCQYPGMAVYPDVHNTLNRFDVQAKYMFDDAFMKSAGFAGKAYVKARVLWEKNSNDSWQSLQNQYGYLVNPGNATTAYSIWMANGNPNYDVVLGQLSFGVKW